MDIFNPTNERFTRLVTGSAAGGTVDALNSPWGLALAPSTFGTFSDDLLVGNFGNGEINAFDPTSGAFLGTLADHSGKTLVDDGLWGITFGNGGRGSSTDTLYFAAGINGEQHGLFGSIAPAAVPEPGTYALLAVGLLPLAGVARRRRAACSQRER